jgi:hypothetical protein
VTCARIALLALLTATAACDRRNVPAPLGSPADLERLRRDCGDGALAAESEGRIYLTELATGGTTPVGQGRHPEFSPDGSKLAWLDGEAAMGRMRKGDTTVRRIAGQVDPAGGVHWVSDVEVAVVRGGRWRRVHLDGTQGDIPELDALGLGGRECDVRRTADGVWAYVSGSEWRTSDGTRGRTGGQCSGSFSPDGRRVTGLLPDHRRCALTPVRPGAPPGELRWAFPAPEGKGFDNHRWSSNDPRYIVCQDEEADELAILRADGAWCTRMGAAGRGEMYGDFTVGDGRGAPWPARRSEPPSVAVAAVATGSVARAMGTTGVLVAKSRFPDRREYPDALVVYRYRLQAPAGTLAAGDHVLVAHRGVRKGVVSETIRDRVVRSEFPLRIEPLEAHPEVKSLMRVDHTDDLESPLFLDVEAP